MSDKPTKILLRWTADCIKYIGDKLFLTTGTNEVDVASWEKLRWTVADITVPEGTSLSKQEEEEGRIIELVSKVIVGKDGKTASVEAAATIKDLDIKDAIKVIGDCDRIVTLEAWKEVESRDSVRAAILNRLEAIEKGE